MGEGIGPGNLPDASIDALSGATQKPGHGQLTWACTDAGGRAVPPWRIYYKIEGNISYEKRVIWEGTITVGGTPNVSAAAPTYIPETARTAGKLLAEVNAKFQPSH